MENKQYMVTIFTPTYNRAYILEQLYKSLLRQTNKDFYWLLIDDGSTDTTEMLVKKWQGEKKITIEYIKKENSGKSNTMNRALEIAKGKLFFCVDSDDYLSDDAVEKIVNYSKNLHNGQIGILAGRKNYRTNEKITQFKGKKNSGKLKQLYDEKYISGDTALIYKTDKISQYRFPVFEKEKFVPESYLYDLLDQEGELFILNEYIYMADYLQDGYTKKIKEVIFKNPNGYYEYIAQRLQLENDLKSIFFDNIRCISINMVRKEKHIFKGTRRKWINVIAFPLAVLYYMCTFYKYVR